MAETVRNVNMLSTLLTPPLHEAQLRLFTPESLQARPTRQFNPLRAVDTLMQCEGKRILVVDIGGTAIKNNVAVIDANGKPIIDDSAEACFEKQGAGDNYLPILIEMSKRHKDLPVAVSTGGIVKGGDRLLANDNFIEFVDGLKRFGGSFSQLFGRPVQVMNDAEAGSITGAYEIARRGGVARPVIYMINGGGLGGSAFDRDREMVIAAEPGHVQASREINVMGVDGQCFMTGARPCIEKLSASGAGIEAQWKEITGEALPGKEIAELMYRGDLLALSLYSISAQVIAHAILGIKTSLALPDDVAVVLHGGGFKTGGYVEHMNEILAQSNNPMELITTASLGYSNACMAGLAIAALSR